MIRENQKFLNNIQIIVDMAIIVVSFLLAYYIRFYILNGYKSMSFSDLFIPILISIPMYLLLYTIFDLYTPKRTPNLSSNLLTASRLSVRSLIFTSIILSPVFALLLSPIMSLYYLILYSLNYSLQVDTMYCYPLQNYTKC